MKAEKEVNAMAAADVTQEWREETVRVDETDLIVVRGGAGPALLVLHEELGWPGWLKWNTELARKHTLIIPQHPGFTRTARAEWISNVRDQAGFYARYDFQPSPTDPLHMLLLLKDARALIRTAAQDQPRQ